MHLNATEVQLFDHSVLQVRGEKGIYLIYDSVIRGMNHVSIQNTVGRGNRPIYVSQLSGDSSHFVSANVTDIQLCTQNAFYPWAMPVNATVHIPDTAGGVGPETFPFGEPYYTDQRITFNDLCPGF